MNIDFKKRVKKYGTIALGASIGMFVPGSQLLAQNRNSDDPYIFNGPNGSRISTTNRSGRFNSIQQLGMEIIRFIETIIVPFIMALALLSFLWGILHYIRKGGEPSEREQARQFMLWGVIGLAVMASVWGLVRIITNTLGVPLGIPSLDPIK